MVLENIPVQSEGKLYRYRLKISSHQWKIFGAELKLYGPRIFANAVFEMQLWSILEKYTITLVAYRILSVKDSIVSV